jgi:hypothetical protein
MESILDLGIEQRIHGTQNRKLELDNTYAYDMQDLVWPEEFVVMSLLFLKTSRFFIAFRYYKDNDSPRICMIK